MNNLTTELAFSEDALLNRALFLSQLNDINFYVEDTGKEYEYEEIFERLFEQSINTFAIFPLGGKKEVIKKHQSSNSLVDDNGKLNIFIIDGDFDNLWEDQKISSPNLIYLTRYNIESYYCDKEAVIKYMRSFLRCPRRETEEKIKFDDWWQFFKKEAGELFVLFALLKRHCPQISNVKRARGDFLSPEGHVPHEKLKAYKKRISTELGQTKSLISEINKKIQSNFDGNEDEKVLSIVCGKYQFDSLCCHLKTCCGIGPDRIAFQNTLISNFDIKSLFFLKEQVLQLFRDNYHKNIN